MTVQTMIVSRMVTRPCPKNLALLLKQIRKHDWMAQSDVGDTVTSTVTSVGGTFLSLLVMKWNWTAVPDWRPDTSCAGCMSRAEQSG